MLTDISTILSNYAQDNDYYFLLEYESGANSLMDRFLLGKQDYALYENIIETADIERDDTGRVMTIERTIEVIMFKKSPTKDDMGANYYPIIFDLENRLLDLYKHVLLTIDNVSTGAQIETGIDRLDSTMCMAKITFQITDSITIC